MLPAWADVLIVAAIPVIVLAAVWLFAEGDEPDNGVEHHQQDEPLEEDPGELEFAA